MELDASDSIMADKGFVIEDLRQEKGVNLNIPPFIRNDAQLTDAELIQTRRIAYLRIHVEQAMERIRERKRTNADALPSDLSPLMKP